MIGLIPNIFAAANALNLLDFRRPHQASSGQAIDIGQCPAVSDIHSKPYTDPDLPPPYGEGYEYSAHTRGRTWKGQTAGTDDDYLAPGTHSRQRPSPRQREGYVVTMAERLSLKRV